jgi:Zn finger protein HypA/HybF involved in hydrogenase expression
VRSARPVEGTRMHELAAMGELVDAVIASVAEHRPCRVDVVRVRRGSTFSHEALVQGFAILAAGTPLEGARIVIEVVNRVVDCTCGRSPLITSDDLLGHLWVCSICGHVEEIDEHDDLELIDVTLTGLEVADPLLTGSR